MIIVYILRSLILVKISSVAYKKFPNTGISNDDLPTTFFIFLKHNFHLQ